MITPETCWYKDVCTLDIDCNDQCPRYKCLLAMFKRSNIPQAKWKQFDLICSDNDYDAYVKLQNIKKDIENYIKHGNNLYIYSRNTGNGKTSWAIRLMSAYFGKTWQYRAFDCAGLYVSVISFMQLAKDNMSNPTNEYSKICNNIINADVVIWDDIATTKLTEYENKLLFNLIDNRVMNEKSNIYTTNISPEQLNSQLGDRLTSRILGYCDIVHFVDPDKRGGII